MTPRVEIRDGYTLSHFAGICVVGSAFLSSWGGVTVAGIGIADVLLALASIILLIELAHTFRVPGIPSWLVFFVVALIMLAAFQVILPVSDSYVASRDSLARVSSLLANSYEGSSYVQAGKWAVAAFLLPILSLLIAQTSRGHVTAVASAWVSGASVSAAVAVADYLGWTSAGSSLLGFKNITDRESGLASHPNNLGISCAMAIPVALWMLQRKPRLGLACLALSIAGAVLSGSRAAQAAMLLFLAGGAVYFSWRSRQVRSILKLAIPLVVIGMGAFALSPAGLSFFRFSGSSSYVDESDEGRSILAAQALADFEHNPISGIGINHVTEAHSVPLQLLGAGGIFLAITFAIYIVGVVRNSYELRLRLDGLSVACLLSICTWMVAGIVSNQLVDRYLYYPVAIIVALTGTSVASQAVLSSRDDRRTN